MYKYYWVSPIYLCVSVDAKYIECVHLRKQGSLRCTPTRTSVLREQIERWRQLKPQWPFHWLRLHAAFINLNWCVCTYHRLLEIVGNGVEWGKRNAVTDV